MDYSPLRLQRVEHDGNDSIEAFSLLNIIEVMLLVNGLAGLDTCSSLCNCTVNCVES